MLDNLRYEEKPKQYKNHKIVGGELLQINKKFSHMKQKQKEKIAGWIRIEFEDFYNNNNRFPKSKLERDELVNKVYEKIKEREIWIPFGEFRKYFFSKQTKIKNRILKNKETRV